jgi:hypothetical protein
MLSAFGHTYWHFFSRESPNCQKTRELPMHRLFIIAVAMLVLSADARSQDAPRFRTVPWAVWVAAGTNFDNYSLALGVRRDVFGLGLGYVRSTENEPPAYSTATPPQEATIVKEYQLQKVGIDLLTMQQLTDWLGGYASVGLYVDINTVLLTDSAATAYYASPDHPDWTNPEVQFGAGLELQPFEWLVVGAGWHAARGVNIHLGYRW